jgi:hypothetical protein
MKFLRRFLFTVMVLLTIAVLFRGCIFRNTVTYRSAGTRQPHAVTAAALADAIAVCAEAENNPDVETVIADALALTDQTLCFASTGTTNNPNTLIVSERAHCVGYAAFFTTVCNELLRKNNMQQTWVAQQHIGKLTVFGKDIHAYFQSSFFRDHDFVIIKNKVTGETIAVDPSLYDYLYVDRVHLVQ